MKLPAKIRNFNGRQAKKLEFFESSKNLENDLMGTFFGTLGMPSPSGA